jgi:hypothetical protein
MATRDSKTAGTTTDAWAELDPRRCTLAVQMIFLEVPRDWWVKMLLDMQSNYVVSQDFKDLSKSEQKKCLQSLKATIELSFVPVKQ